MSYVYIFFIIGSQQLDLAILMIHYIQFVRKITRDAISVDQSPRIATNMFYKQAETSRVSFHSLIDWSISTHCNQQTSWGFPSLVHSCFPNDTMAPRSLAAVPDKISIHQKCLSRDLRDGLPRLWTNNRWLPKVWPDPSAMARKKTCKAKKMRKPSGKLQFGPY